MYQRNGKGHVKDINNNDNNYYLILFNKYKKRIEEENENKKINIISQCKNCKEYADLTLEEQEKLFMDLMSVNKRFK